MARKKRDDDAPDNNPKKNPHDRGEPIDLSNWRQLSTSRAHYRNRVTYVAKLAGEHALFRRGVLDKTQIEWAEELYLPDGTPHPGLCSAPCLPAFCQTTPKHRPPGRGTARRTKATGGPQGETHGNRNHQHNDIRRMYRR